MGRGFTRINTDFSLSRMARYALYAVCGALLIGFSAFFIYHSYLALTFPYQLEYGEGPVLDWAARLPRGAPLYKPIAGYPYSFPVYTPFYIWLASLFLPLTPDNLYLGGRFISLLSALGVAVAIYKIVRAESPSDTGKLYGGVAALLFLASPFAYRWATFYRPDMLALCFSIWGFYVVRRYYRSRWVYLSVPLFLLGIYTKHSFVAAPMAAYVWLLLNAKHETRNRGIIAGAWLAGGGLGVFVITNAVTRGAFFTDIVLANANPYSWELAWNFVKGFLGIVPILASGALVYLGAARPPRFKKTTRVLKLYLITATLTVLSIGKAGSWENYFLEILVIFCAIAGVGLQSVRATRWHDVGVLLVIGQLLLYPRGLFHQPWQEAEILSVQAATRQKLAEIIAAYPDPILVEDMGVLAENSRVVPIHTFVYTQLASQGLWDQEWILTALAEQEFSLIIMRAGGRYDYEDWHRFSPQMLSGVDRYYEVFASVDGRELYRPAAALSPLNANYEDEIALLGYRITISDAPTAFNFTLLWQAQTDISTDYTVFTHLVDSSGQIVTQLDQQPRAGVYPTSRWQSGEVVRDSYTIPLPAGVPPRPIKAHVGLYHPATGKRLPVHRENGEGAEPSPEFAADKVILSVEQHEMD